MSLRSFYVAVSLYLTHTILSVSLKNFKYFMSYSRKTRSTLAGHFALSPGEREISKVSTGHGCLCLVASCSLCCLCCSWHIASIWFSHLCSFMKVFHTIEELWAGHEFSALDYIDFRQGEWLKKSRQSYLPCLWLVVSIWFTHLWSFMNIFRTVKELWARHQFSASHYMDFRQSR